MFWIPISRAKDSYNAGNERSSASSASAGHQPSEEEDEHYMRLALKEAEKAFEAGEVPVGAVLVHKKRPERPTRDSSIAQHLGKQKQPARARRIGMH